jgi:hypothetical protein
VPSSVKQYSSWQRRKYRLLWKSFYSFLMLLYVVMNMIRIRWAWKSLMMFLPPTAVEGWRKSIVPLSSIFGGQWRPQRWRIRENNSENVDIIVHATPNTAVNCFRTTASDIHHTISTMNDTPDDRVITHIKLKVKISKCGDLNETQRVQLLAILMKYQLHLTKRPVKCNGF